MKTLETKKRINKSRTIFWGILLIAVFGAIISNAQINNSVTGLAVAVASNNIYMFAALLGIGCICLIGFIFILLRRLKIRLAEEEMISWVYKARKMGYNDDRIRDMLTQYNWSPETIQTIIQSVDIRAPSSTNIPPSNPSARGPNTNNPSPAQFAQSSNNNRPTSNPNSPPSNPSNTP